MSEGNKRRAKPGGGGAAPGEEETLTLTNGRRLQVQPERPGRWTKRKKEIFFVHLAATCNVSASAREAGMGPTGVYKHRAIDPSFRARWDEALAIGYARLEMMLIERATNGGAPAALEGDKEVDLARLDSRLAMELLRHHQGRPQGQPKRGGARRRKASPEELDAFILKKLSLLNKRLGGAG